ncbi:MAG: helix-turn-helix domain-containing protein [Actinobacteria bacterium]|nr:helix-turn-helix domain-containing protein [Actinomycetota bacterium]
MPEHPPLAVRAERHAALGDPVRLALVDDLTTSDRSPVELAHRHDLPSNLLAHHLDVLERVGLIERSRSSGDGRRRYVHLRQDALAVVTASQRTAPGSALFVCTANSARSQLAAGLWRQLTGEPAESAGTHPADRVHPGAIAAGRRAGIDLADAEPTTLALDASATALVVTVCDRAHEELDPDPGWLHWSIPDPVPDGRARAFDRTVAELRDRIVALAGPGHVA